MAEGTPKFKKFPSKMERKGSKKTRKRKAISAHRQAAIGNARRNREGLMTW